MNRFLLAFSLTPAGLAIATLVWRAVSRLGRLRVALVAAMCVLVAVGGVAGAGASSAGVSFTACGPEVFPGFECGTFEVPLDRANPSAGMIPVAFQLFPHWGEAAAPSEAIVVSIGGPGYSNTALSLLWLFRFQADLEHRDLLVLDHRGTGASAAIDCPALQHFAGDLAQATRDCGAQLGAAADRYGSGDVADDVEALRAALGIDKLDYYGDSYGAVDVRAYAYRYPSHLRSAVFDSPWLSEDWTFYRSSANMLAGAQATVCRRSPSCSAANPDPEGTLAWLVRELRKHPVDGVGYDADGGAHNLHVDESTIFDILSNEHFADPAFLNQGELTAAAEALRHGDPAPLLRLAAESPPPVDSGDPTGLFNAGASTATFCADGRFVWDKNAPEATREAQYQAAVAALNDDDFAPFSATAWLTAQARVPGGLLGAFTAEKCVNWPSPARPDDPYPANQPFPAGVPALLLSGALDVLPPSDVRAALPLFSAGTPFVEVANAGHITGSWSDCAQGIIDHFIDTFQTGDTSCAADLNAPMHFLGGASSGLVQLQGVGSFPRKAEQAIPAQEDAAATDQSPLADRRLASVAWSTVEDAVYRSFRMLGTDGRGLRGGSYTVSRSETTTTITYTGTRYTEDVAISGTATLDRATNSLDATIEVDGSGNQDGILTLHGLLWDPSQPTAQIRGTLRNRHVAVTVPAY
jgi:pimeloyl-ACP methyl ester carboxylesterase